MGDRRIQSYQMGIHGLSCESLPQRTSRSMSVSTPMLQYLRPPLYKTCLLYTGPCMTAPHSLCYNGLYQGTSHGGGGVCFSVSRRSRLRLGLGLVFVSSGRIQSKAHPAGACDGDLLGGTIEEDRTELLRAALGVASATGTISYPLVRLSAGLNHTSFWLRACFEALLNRREALYLQRNILRKLSMM